MKKSISTVKVAGFSYRRTAYLLDNEVQYVTYDATTTVNSSARTGLALSTTCAALLSTFIAKCLSF